MIAPDDEQLVDVAPAPAAPADDDAPIRFDTIIAGLRFCPCPRCNAETPARRLPSGEHIAQLCDACDRRRTEAQAARDAAIEAERSIPDAFRWSRFGAPDLAKRVQAAPTLLERARHAAGAVRIVITGAAGTGKTSLAVAIMRERLSMRPGPMLFVPTYRLARARMQTRAGQGEAPIVDEALHVPWLLLDDLGSEKDSPINACPDVIFERHAALRPTLITTGFDEDGIAGKYGDGIARRVFERAIVITLGEEATTG